MSLVTEPIVKKLKSFLSFLEESSRVAMLYDSDSDGISSGVIAAKTLQRRFKVKPIVSIGAAHGSELLSKDVIDKLLSEKINLLICTDLAVEKFPEQLEKLSKQMRILIIDHHKMYRELDLPNVLLIKPQMFEDKIDPSQYCTAKLTYDLFESFAEISDLEWLAATGIIADSGYLSWKSFTQKVLKKHGYPIKKDPFQTALGKICNTIAYAEIYDSKNVGKIFKDILESESLSDFLKKPMPQTKGPEDELIFFQKNAAKIAEHYGDLVILHISPKYRIGSVLSTRLGSGLYKKKTLVIVQDIHDYPLLLISARRTDFKKPVNDLLESAAEGLTHASAGGHIPAAGARILKIDYARFKRRLIRQNEAM